MSSRSSPRDRLLLTLALAGSVLGLVAFGIEKSAATGESPPNSKLPLDVPVTKLFPGGGPPPPGIANVKKYQGNPTYVAAGKAIFDHFNCSGCHFHGAGGMGPPFFNGGHFIYGGRLDQIYASIYQGRPNGMPSWAQKIPEQEIWEIAAYVKALSSEEHYVDGGPMTPAEPVAGGNAQHGAELIANHGCGSCHMIPGINNADGAVGPPLNKIADRTVIAGIMPNTPDNMIAWVENPQAIVPGNAMPNLGLNDNEARDIAAYLYTLH